MRSMKHQRAMCSLLAHAERGCGLCVGGEDASVFADLESDGFCFSEGGSLYPTAKATPAIRCLFCNDGAIAIGTAWAKCRVCLGRAWILIVLPPIEGCTEVVDSDPTRRMAVLG
jgi:hypothetical protein